MVSQFREALLERINAHLNRVLRAAEIGIPGSKQYEAFRNFTLNEFGNQGFLPELDALLKQYGQERTGQADTAGKEVLR